MNIVGLTGGIATGKSTVSRFLSTLNTPIIDADIINQQLLLPQQEGYLKILQLFPDTPILTDQALDKRYLRHKIFAHKASKQQLEKYLHPIIKKQILAEINALKQRALAYCIVSVPLLVEAKFTHLVDEVWVTDCSEEMQLSRLMKRDTISLSDAKLIMSHQLTRAERLKHADQIIETEHLDVMENRLIQLHQQQINLHSN